MALTKFTEKLISDSFKASISGSDTTESSSFASRVTLVEGGTTSKTLVSSSAQIADDISGSLSSTAIASLGASIVSASVLSSPSQGTIRLAINGVNTDVDSGLQAGDSPTFAGGTVTGDFAVGGTLTAQEVHTEFESASILFTSGSTQFGNSSDDVHEFKGNTISGSVSSTGSFGSLVTAGLITATTSGGEVSTDANGHITSFQKLDVATAGGRLIGKSNRGTLGRLMIEQTANSTDGGYIRFETSPNGSTTPTEKMRITEDGKVGIGTATPVSGGLHIHTDASTEGIYLKSTGNTRNNLVFDSNISSAADNIAFIDANWNETNVARISMFTGTDTSNQDDGRIGFATAAAGTVAERMRIETDGSVGIHTTSPNIGSYTSERGVLTIGSTDNGSANNYANLELQGHAIANNVTVGDISWYDHTNYNAIVRGGRDSSTTTGYLAFFTNGGSGVGERMRIDKDGHVEINDGNLVIGTSGHGIDFSATSNATGMSSELLDDYEEGVYDITIGGLGGGSIGLDSSKQALSYTKIGRQVTVQGEISVTSVSSLSGTMTINLPFSVGSTIGDLSSRAVGSFSSQNHNYHDLSLTIHSHTYEGQSVMYFVYHKDNAGWEYVNTNTLASNTEFRVSLTYFTN